MTQWEYRVESLAKEQVKNQLDFIGREGWELVQILWKPDSPYPYEAVFKRERSE
jgi:hypothetical protein